MLCTDTFIVYRGLDDQQYRFDRQALALMNRTAGLKLTFDHILSERWPDGELGHRPTEYAKIAGKHVILFACPTTDRLELEMRDMITACKKQYGGKSLTLGMSFLRYRRQDRQDKHHEINRLRWFIGDLKHWGVDHLVLCEPHSVVCTKKFCREFGLPVTIADTTELFAEAMTPLLQTIGRSNFVVYAPDFGSVGRAIALAQATGTSVVALPKKRLYGDEVVTGFCFSEDDFLRQIRRSYGDAVPVSCNVGDVKGRYVAVRDDEVSTGSTAIATSHQLRAAGALGTYFIATHAVCTAGWSTKLALHSNRPPFDNIWFGNTRPRGEEGGYRESSGGRIQTVDLAPVFARAMVVALRKVVRKHR